MTRRSFRVSLLTAIALLIIGASGLVAQRTTRPAPKPEPVNLKIRYKTTMAGQSSESTTMLKGARERSEMRLGHGMEIINLTQCDLKRTVQISDKTRKKKHTTQREAK